MFEHYTLVVCELAEIDNLQNYQRQSFEGIRIGQRLRMEGFRKPIVFTSFLSRKQLTEGHLDRAIVNAVGHSFIRLPYTNEELIAEVNRLKKQLSSDDGRPVLGELSDLELYDIQNNYCQKYGMAQLKIHALEGMATRGDLSMKKVVEECEECLEQVCSLFNESSSSVVAEFKRTFDQVDVKEKGKLIRWVSSYCLELVESNTGDATNTKLRAKYPWKLLMVDDEIEENHPLIDELRSRDIEVLLSHSAEKAEAILEDDNPFHPRIMVVLSDYRLEEQRDGVRVHQAIQGYQFLQHVTASGRIVKIAALSAMPRKFLLESFKHYGIRAQVYSKKDFALDQQTSINFLADEMVNLGNENWDSVQSLPDTKGWKDMEGAYVRYHTHPNFTNMERKVSYLVKANLEVLTETGEFADIFKTPSNAYSPKKSNGVIDVEKDVIQFMDYMKSRRVAIWLGAVRKPPMQLDDIITKMAKEEKTENMRKQILNKLGVVLSDFPFGITIEEQRWLQYDMGVNVLKKVETGHEVMERIRQRVMESFLKHKFLQEYLSGTDFLSWTYNNEVIDVYFIPTTYYPLVRSSNGVKALVGRINEDIVPGSDDYLDRLGVLSGLRKDILNIIAPFTELPSFSSLKTFLNTLAQPTSLPVLRKGVVKTIYELRDREYQRLVEPWTLLKYGQRTNDELKAFLVELILTVQNDSTTNKGLKGVKLRLVELILERKDSIPSFENVSAFNQFIYELVDTLNTEWTKETDQQIKEDGKKEIIDIVATDPILDEDLNLVFGFDASLQFKENEDEEGHYFSEEEKVEFGRQLRATMTKFNAKADPDEDVVVVMPPALFLTLSQKWDLQKSANWQHVKAIVYPIGDRIKSEMNMVDSKSDQLEAIASNTYTFTY